MAVIKKATRVDKDKQSPFEPFACIRYDGSYSCASTVLGMIGIDNLAFENPDVAKNGITDELIDSLMDNNSNLHLPEINYNKEYKLSGSRALTLSVGSWVVMEIDRNNGFTEIVFYPDSYFRKIYKTV